MTDAPTLAVRLYGTDEPVEPPRLLKAGPLTAELEAGNLRYVRYEGIEIIRAVSFIVRDRDWGTYNPRITNLKVEETGDSFTVTYDAVARDASQEFGYQAEIRGSAGGTLSFRGSGRAVTDFVTNRTGFVVLHPVEGVAGAPVEIEHVDGRVVASSFPALIDPVQPMMDLRQLTHEAAPGLKVACRMEGDTFEMEDQRNWSDASYKTYVRPLALPWPYTLKLGEEIDQAVTLTVTGRPSGGAGGGDTVTVALGGQAGTAPSIGIGLDPDDADAALERAEVLKALGVRQMIIHHDPRRGHDRASLERQLAVAAAVGAEPWLEALVVSVEDAESEIAALGAMVGALTSSFALGSPFKTVLLSPAADLKSTLPGSTWPPCPPAEVLFRSARAAFPGARLGGGMFSFFTELNRKRPPTELIDVVSFTTSALVHAGDDRSAIESLEALPSIAASAAAIAKGKPWMVGPSAIGMRSNPYGAAPKANPANIRQAMNFNDPRQRGLLGAAFALGYVARFAYGGASAVTLGGPTGAFGAVHAPAGWPQPWYDQRGGGHFPVFHVLRGLASLRGKPLKRLDISKPGTLQGLAVATDGGTEIWLANLTSRPQAVQLDAAGDVATLDAASFVRAAEDPTLLDTPTTPFGGTLTLDAYGVAHIRST